VIQLLDSTIALVALAALAWAVIAAIVLAACTAAARADTAMSAQDDAIAMAGPMGLLLSQAFAREDMADGAQEDLHIPPERPVRDVEVVHRAHLA
jgi:hypothetical protein